MYPGPYTLDSDTAPNSRPGYDIRALKSKTGDSRRLRTLSFFTFTRRRVRVFSYYPFKLVCGVVEFTIGHKVFHLQRARRDLCSLNWIGA